MTLAEFLLARITEDEAGARAATQGTWNVFPWHVPSPRYTTYMLSADDDNEPIADFRPDPWEHKDGDQPVFAANAYHGARWQPRRVLAECEAKRLIVEFCVDHDNQGLNQGGATYLLQCLALTYADHFNYDESWRPEDPNG
jgi:hypothetical protein